MKIEDMKGKKRKEWWSNMDVLAAIVKVARKKFNKKKRKQKEMMKMNMTMMMQQSSHSNIIASDSSNYHQITKIKIQFSSKNSTESCIQLEKNVRPREQSSLIKKPPPLLILDEHIQRKPSSWATDNWIKKFNCTAQAANKSNKACLEKPKYCDGEKAVILKEKNQRKKKVASSSIIGPNLELLENITGKGGSEIQLVIQKSLFNTDVSKGHNRLSMPLNLIEQKDFLTKEEESILKTRHNGKKFQGIECLLIEPSWDESSIVLKKWDMEKSSGKTSSSYVLVTYWNDVVRRNNLNTGMVVQLWSFRVDSKLCLALVRV